MRERDLCWYNGKYSKGEEVIPRDIDDTHECEPFTENVVVTIKIFYFTVNWRFNFDTNCCNNEIKV